MAHRPTSQLEAKTASLLGQRVAFTGRFADLSKRQLEQLVERAGGYLLATVTPKTTLLVVGVRGWPLMESGRVTRKFARARQVRGCRIVSEDEFREMVGVSTPPASLLQPKSLDLAQVCETLQLDTETVRRWELLGLVRSQAGRYDFQDLVSLRAIARIAATGVPTSRIRESLASLAMHLPGIDRPLAQLNVLVSDSNAGRLVAELGEALLAPDGQFEMQFDRKESPGRVHSLAEHRTHDGSLPADGWLERLESGLDSESRGALREAERSYRQAVEDAPAEPTAHFNLGNALLAQGRYAAAADSFERCLALDGSHSRAWFNLAHAREHLNDHAAAVSCLERAVKADPAYADAYFNLADLTERLGRDEQACRAWSEYLRLDPMSEWAAEARRRLQRTRGPAWA